MSDGKVIEFADVTMVFGDVPAVDGLTARVDPGRVTAFLGPNGAGKTTTLRVLLGDLRPSRGRATIGGSEYQRIARPAASIGAVMSLLPLEKARRKTVAKYLERQARRVGVGVGRVREVLTIVGLAEMADMRIGNLSLGMKHRLAVAEALLGDPSVLVFDEPANGLDPEGIRWIRLLMRRFADEGRTVLMSSHVLSEVEQVADALLVLNQGSLLFEGPIELLSEAESGPVTVDAEDRDELLAVLDDAGLDYRILRSGITIDSTTTAEVGSLAAKRGLALTTLTHRGPSLEDIYLRIIDGTWTAPARTAALSPSHFAADAPGDDAAEGAGDAHSGTADSGTDDTEGEAGIKPADATAESADEDARSNEADTAAIVGAVGVAGASGAADAAGITDDREDDADDAAIEDAQGADAELFEGDADANTSNPADDTHEGDAHEASDDTTPDGTDPAGADTDTGTDADVDTGADADAGTNADVDADASLDADAADTATPHAAGAVGGLPGLAGLAGLAQGLRAGDEDGVGNDEDDPSAGAVSPSLRAAFERAGQLERDADDIESDIEAREARADAGDDWEAQLRALFDDESDTSADNDAFPTANFEVPGRD
ncbi:hypothetical protein GCM10010915_06960 [Microbacterium faecale]|uniref:ABC transporter domain-containing protein n=1 Tax=Microbacterium faecale TaxID=1804630 RepID=A0A916Y3H9_9MICO|nr:ABC transporter ATP-binding protein [Microbacterium faecale]GGD29378.1 hypothetical protein GCM10010915_06960 [Microbacterium faecale]